MNKEAIQAALDDYARAIHGNERGDSNDRHVSDLMGCDRATWARLVNASPPPLSSGPLHSLKPKDADTLRKFLFGFCAEEYALEAMLKLGPVQEGVRVCLSFGVATLQGRVVDNEYKAQPNELIGHPDGVTKDAVIEVKSTEFLVDRKTYKRIVYQKESDFPLHYRVQCAAYALALSRPFGVLIVICRATGLTAVCVFDPKEYLKLITQRGLEVISIDPSMPMPNPTLPAHTLNAKGLSWMCKYCDFTACPLWRQN